MVRLMDVKLRKIGGAEGVILPKEATGRLKVKEGDRLFLIEAPDGYKLTPYDPAVEQQMTVGRNVTRKWREALRELAK